MAEPILPTLPEFPTQWGEGEQERLSTLKEQKTRMDELYKSKFAPEAWESTPGPEKLFRGLLPDTVFEPIVSKLTPWQWGFDYGVTPEQARERMQMAETEYQELLRMQRVVTILPSIQNTLRALALSEATIITTREELDKYFKLSKLGFTEEEQAYVVNFAKNLLGMSEEDLTSGEPLGLKPMTSEEFDSLIGGDVPILQPGQIMSTVAFSKDIDQVVQTLRQAYPPVGGELDITKGKENVLQEYINALRDMGVDVSETDSLPEMASKAFDILGAGKGWVMPTDESGLPLIDPATNEPVVYVIDDDNYAWYGEDIIAYYDEDTGNLAPLSLDGTPLITDEQKQHALEDLGQASIISMWQASYLGEQYVLNAIPSYFSTNVFLGGAFFKGGKGVPGEPLVSTKTTAVDPRLMEGYYGEAVLPGGVAEGTPTWTAQAKYLKETVQYFKEDYFAREQAYVDDLTEFFKENPDWIPRPEWTQPLVERWKEDPGSVFDAGYLAYQMASNIHVYLAVAASIGVTYATGNPLLGMGTAMGMFLPMETESLRADLIASGASYELATQLSIPGGVLISSLESIGNIPILKAFAPQFFAGFKASLTHGLAKTLLQYGVITPAKIGFTEVFLEEVPQEVLHNLIVSAVDENRHLLENVSEVIAQSLVTMAPLAFMGGGGEYLNMKRHLPPEVQNQIDGMSRTFVDNGMSEDQAELLSYNYLTSTETGMAQVELAYEEAISSQNPDSNTWTEASKGNVTYEDWASTTASSQDMVSNMASMEKQIDDYNKEIADLEERIEEREAKIVQAKELATDKKKTKDQEEILTILQEQLEELTIKRQKLIDGLVDMRRTVTEEPPPKVARLEGGVKPAVEEKPFIREQPSMKSWQEMLTDPKIRELYPELEIAADKLGKAIDRDSAPATKDKLEAKVIEIQQKIAREHPELSFRGEEAVEPEAMPALNPRFHSTFGKKHKERWNEIVSGLPEVLQRVKVKRLKINSTLRDSRGNQIDALTGGDGLIEFRNIEAIHPHIVAHELAHLWLWEHMQLQPKVDNLTMIKAWAHAFNDSYLLKLIQAKEGTKVDKPAPITWDNLDDAAEETFCDAVPDFLGYPDPDTGMQILDFAQENFLMKYLGLQEGQLYTEAKHGKVEPEEVEGIPMPEAVRQGLIEQADGWLNQVETRKPSALHVIGIPEGEALVRTDSTGRPMIVATLLMREGKLTLSTIASAEDKLANGRALLDIINYIKTRKDIFFPPEAEMSPVALKIYRKISKRMEAEKAGEEPLIEPGLDEGEMKLTGIRLPREVMLKTELNKADMATRTHPEIVKHVRLNKDISGLREQAKSNWESADEEARLAIAKRMHLGKSFIAKSWDGMSDYERGIVALDYIPDGSLHFNMAREIADMEEFMEFLEEATGLPFTAIYERSARAKNISEASKEYIVKEFSENPEYRSVLEDADQLLIATQELNARNEIQGVEHPEDALLTPEIMSLVDAIQHIYDLYKPYVRYMEFMRTEAKLKALKARFPDAIKAGKESELIMALELRNRGQYDGLWQFLKGCTWGVYEYGFDPRQMAAPDLRTQDVPMGYVIGAASLNMRTRVEFPGFGKFRKNLVQRMLSYVTQMEIQWEIEPELRNFQKLWDMAYWKFENKDEIKGGLNKWWGIMQGIPSSYGWWTRQARKVWRQSMTAIFLEPVLSLRNTAQAINLHMDRTELFRFLIRGKQEITPIQRAKAKRFYDIFVSQLGGLRKYVLLVNQPGLPGLGWLNKAADSLNIYGWSDYLPRLWSFYAYFNKANRATTQFLKDNDVGKFLKNSGAMHLRQTERNFLLTHYLSRANDTFNLRVDGLESVTGAEMAAFYIARRNTDHTHFKYARWARGLVEMGPLGETMWNLFVFPRGYGQRVTWQAEKIAGLFKGEATWEEARGGFNDLIKLFVVAQLFSSLWKNVSGRKRNPYDPFSVLTQWTFGGLFVGAMQDITELMTDVGMSVNIWGDEDQREQAKGRLPGKFSDLAEMMVPFYRRVIDIWAAFEDTPDQDIHWLRKMREQFEEGYSADELDKLDMTLWEKMKKAALGANPPDSDAWEKSQTAMQDSRDLLGTRDAQGKYYTLENHAGVVSSSTRGFPDIFVSDYAGSHELDIFFKDCEAQWEEYYLLPTTPSTIRKDWRIEHPEEEAMMLFWGKLHAAALPSGEVYEGMLSLLVFWSSVYGINKFMFPKGATWKDEVELGLDLTRE